MYRLLYILRVVTARKLVLLHGSFASHSQVSETAPPFTYMFMQAMRDAQSPMLKGKKLISTDVAQAGIKPQVADMVANTLDPLGYCTTSASRQPYSHHDIDCLLACVGRCCLLLGWEEVLYIHKPKYKSRSSMHCIPNSWILGQPSIQEFGSCVSGLNTHT